MSGFRIEEELKEFLQLQNKDIFVVALNDENDCCKRLAYLSDIFAHLNKLNLKLQGIELNLITFKNTLRGFIAKLQNWLRKVYSDNSAMFENASDLHEVELILLNSLNRKYHSIYMRLNKN